MVLVLVPGPSEAGAGALRGSGRRHAPLQLSRLSDGLNWNGSSDSRGNVGTVEVSVRGSDGVGRYIYSEISVSFFICCIVSTKKSRFSNITVKTRACVLAFIPLIMWKYVVTSSHPACLFLPAAVYPFYYDGVAVTLNVFSEDRKDTAVPAAASTGKVRRSGPSRQG